MKRKTIIPFVCILTIALAALLASCGGLGDAISGKNNDDGIALATLTVTSDNENFIYDGSEKRVELKLYDRGSLVTTLPRNGAHADLAAEYYDNVNAGTARVIISPKEKNNGYKGSVEYKFRISQVPSVTVTDYATLKDCANSGNYSEVKLGADIITPADDNLNVIRGTTLNVSNYVLEANGSMTNNGTIMIGAEGKMFLHGGFGSSGTLTATGVGAEIYADTYFKGGTIDSDIAVYQRYSFTPTLEYGFIDYTGEPLRPAVTLGDADMSLFVIEYLDNVDVGEAIVRVTAPHDSKQYCGSCEVRFKILSGLKTATTNDELNALLADKNNMNILLSGSFPSITVPEGVEVKADAATIEGNLTVAGKLTIASGKTLSVTGKLSATGKIENSGTLTIDGEYSAESEAQFENSGSAYLGGALNNGGQISNIGALYLLNEVNNSSPAIANSGSVLSDYALGDIVTNSSYKAKTILRQPITEQNVTLSDSVFGYNGYNKVPVISFTGGPAVSQSDYFMTRNYEGLSGNAYETKIPGTVIIRIGFKNSSLSYTGTIDIPYTITRGTITVKSDSDFATAFESVNHYYAEAVIDSSIASSKELIVPEDVTLRITERGEFAYSSTLTVNGAFVNNGKALFNGTGNRIVIDEGATFTNEGKLYFNDSKPYCIEDSDAVYVRTELKSAYIVDLPETVPYTEISGMRPEFSVVLEGKSIPKTANWSARYVNNDKISSSASSAMAYAEATTFSETFYGSAVKSFKIERGTITVSYYDTLEKALACTSLIRVENDGEVSYVSVSNFETIYFGSNIGKTYSSVTSSDYPRLTIPAMTTVDMAEYTLNVTVKKGNFKIKNRGTIITRKGFTIDGYDEYGNVYGKASSAADITALAKVCNLIEIENDISDTTYPHEIYVGDMQCALTIDLKGHTVNGVFKVNCNHKNLTITSTDGKGTIKHSLCANSLIVDSISGATCTLDNVKIKKPTSSYPTTVKISSTVEYV